MSELAEPAKLAKPAKPVKSGKSAPGHVVVVGLATWSVIHVIAVVFATNATGTVVLQALAAELGAGRAGVLWSSPPLGGPALTPAQRVAFGTIGGLAFAATLLGLGAATGAIHFAAHGSTSIVALLVAAAVSTAAAVRDELVLRGILLRAAGFGSGARFRRPSWPSAVPFLAAAGLAAALSEPTLGLDAAFRFASGVAFASVWQLDRGAFMACSANAVLRFATGTLVSGGAVDLRVAPGAFAGSSGILSSVAAVALASLFAAALAFRAFGRSRD